MRIALGALGVALLFVLGVVVLAGGIAGPAGQGGATASIAELAAETCPLSGPLPGLSASQAANVDLIVSAAMAASGERVEVARIAVMVAMTESGLRNLDYGTADSLGLFQQQPSEGWGTPAEVMDPTYATDAFVRRLLGVPDWERLAPWQAAQAVQRSAFANGANYEVNWIAAGRIVAAVLAGANHPGACGQGTGGLAGPGGHGLPAGYVIPPGTPPEHAAVVRFVLAALGKPYVWGAAGPAAYDCSGLTMAAWASVGVHLVHYTGTQQHEGQPVGVADLVPGDLVLVPGVDSPGPGIAGHVGIYLGDALVASAIDPAEGVAVQTWSTFVSGGLVALRDPAPGK